MAIFYELMIKCWYRNCFIIIITLHTEKCFDVFAAFINSYAQELHVIIDFTELKY